MSKILIICDVFPPSFAPRMGYLVKYMKEWGWTADIVTREHDGDFSFSSLLGNEHIIRVDGIKTPMNNLKDKFYRLIHQKTKWLKNSKNISQTVIKKLNSDNYCLILCSSAHNIFVIKAAAEVAFFWNKPCILDIRDLYEQSPKLPPIKEGALGLLIEKINTQFTKFTINNRNNSFQRAIAITTVSPWHQKIISPYNDNTNLIYNGFDPETFYPYQQIKQEKFLITYTGTVHQKRHDPTLLFLATKQLLDRGIINKNEFLIQFYVPENWRGAIINNDAFFPVKEFVDFYDYIDTSKVPELLNNSSVLLLLGNRQEANGPKGLISTTKYFEYLAVERPILFVRSDEDLLEASIMEANAGVAARTVQEAYEFLFHKWIEWKEFGYTRVNVNRNYIHQFSRKTQAKQFVDLFEKVCE